MHTCRPNSRTWKISGNQAWKQKFSTIIISSSASKAYFDSSKSWSVTCHKSTVMLMIRSRMFPSAQTYLWKQTLKSMTDCISDVRSWMISDNFKLNGDKAEFLILGTKQQLAKVNIDNIKVGSANVSPVPVVRNLGSWFNSQCAMSSHISKLCSVTFYYLDNIRRIPKYLSQEATGTLVHAFIMPCIDYCNSLLYGLPNSQFAKIRRVVNASVRLVCNVPLVAYQGTHQLQGTSPHV